MYVFFAIVLSNFKVCIFSENLAFENFSLKSLTAFQTRTRFLLNVEIQRQVRPAAIAVIVRQGQPVQLLLQQQELRLEISWGRLKTRSTLIGLNLVLYSVVQWCTVNCEVIVMREEYPSCLWNRCVLCTMCVKQIRAFSWTNIIQFYDTVNCFRPLCESKNFNPILKLKFYFSALCIKTGFRRFMHELSNLFHYWENKKSLLFTFYKFQRPVNGKCVTEIQHKS